MNTTQVMRFKDALEAKRKDLAREMRARTGELAIREGEHDPIDQIQSMNQRDEAVIMLGRLSHTLTQVQAALQAVSQGLYGECVECGEPISLKRLQTIPWASHCISCQELVERWEALQAGRPGSVAPPANDREAA